MLASIDNDLKQQSWTLWGWVSIDVERFYRDGYRSKGQRSCIVRLLERVKIPSSEGRETGSA